MKKNNLDMLSYSGYNFKEGSTEKEINPYWEYSYIPDNFNLNRFNYKDCLDFIHQLNVSACTTAYRRWFIEGNNIYFPENLLFEDNIFYIKSITQATNCGITKEKLYYRRIHRNSITQNWDKHYIDYLKITDLLLKYMKNFDDNIYSLYENSYLMRCIWIYNSFTNEKKLENQKHLETLLNKYNFKSDKIKWGMLKKNKTIVSKKCLLKSYLFFPYYLLKIHQMKKKVKIPINYPNIQYNCIIPIGANCQIAERLRENNKRIASFPFDWLLDYSLDFVYKTIKYGIDDWFIEYKDDKDQVAGRHYLVHDIKNNFIAKHLFPTTHSVEDYYPIFKETFNRRYYKMIDMIKKSKTVCFICNGRLDSVNDFYNFIKKVKKLYPNKKWILLHIQHSDKEHKILQYKPEKNVTIYNVQTYNIHEKGGDWRTNNLSWMGNTKTWNNICSHLKIEETTKQPSRLFSINKYGNKKVYRILGLKFAFNNFKKDVLDNQEKILKMLSDISTRQKKIESEIKELKNK